MATDDSSDHVDFDAFFNAEKLRHLDRLFKILKKANDEI